MATIRREVSVISRLPTSLGRGGIMGERRFDSIVRRLDRASSRRGMLRAVASITASALGFTLVGMRQEAAARRNACQLRCGGRRRQCIVDCRDEGVAARECKRVCRKVRDHCFERCDILAGSRGRWFGGNTNGDRYGLPTNGVLRRRSEVAPRLAEVGGRLPEVYERR
jgi:hypothetical protein